jgi:hypothetical protein
MGVGVVTLSVLIGAAVGMVAGDLSAAGRTNGTDRVVVPLRRA